MVKVIESACHFDSLPRMAKGYSVVWYIFKILVPPLTSCMENLLHFDKTAMAVTVLVQ